MKGLGARPSLPDFRDYISVPERVPTLPDNFSLRDKMPPVYDQGNLGSCTANAIAGAVQYEQMKQGEAEGQNTPSRLFIYYQERSLENSIASDSGAALSDGMRAVKTWGAPPESDWPYDINQFTTKPPDQAYNDALSYKTLKYARPYKSSYYLRNHIVVGRPIIFGFLVYSSFYQAGSAPYIMPTPGSGESLDGGHAVLCTGYRSTPSGSIQYEIRNSWGDGWGDGGYFYMPESYILSECAWDFWNILLEQ